MGERRKFLTDPDDFTDVSRGNPQPHKLTGEALDKARLTAETWRLEIESEGKPRSSTPRSSMPGQHSICPHWSLGREERRQVLEGHAVQQHRPAPRPGALGGRAAARGAPHHAGKCGNVRRVYYWGFHNNDPKQMFHSSLAINQVLDTPPGELPPFVAYRLNGQPIPLERGGPVRMVIPWAHGFKSVKWLQHIA